MGSLSIVGVGAQNQLLLPTQPADNCECHKIHLKLLLKQFVVKSKIVESLCATNINWRFVILCQTQYVIKHVYMKVHVFASGHQLQNWK